MHRAGVDHAGDRVVPEVLLGGRAAARRCRRRVGVLAHEVAGVAAADAGRLHAAVGGEVGRAEARCPACAGWRRRSPRRWRRRGRSRGSRGPGSAASRPGLGLELGEQPVDVVDVLRRPRPSGTMIDVELVADLGDQRGQVVEHPGAVEAVDAGPELGVLAEVRRAGDLDQALAGGLLVVGLDRVLEVAEQDVDAARPCRAPWPPSSGCSGRRSGSSATGGTGSRGSGPGAPTARGVKKSLALRIDGPSEAGAGSGRTLAAAWPHRA